MWVLPTRGRPDRCQVLLDSINAVGSTTPGIVIVDGDADARYDGMTLPAGWSIERNATHCGFLATLNRVFASRPNEPWYGLLNDDFIVHTPEWDKKLIAAAGERGFASCDDGWQRGKRMCGALVFGGELLRAFGWWSPPGLWHCYADNVWEIIGKRLNNWTFVESVLVEHRHYMNQKGRQDATYREAYARFADDEKVFAEFQKKELNATVDRVAALFKTEIDRGIRRLAYARTRKLMIATPIARDPAWQYALSLYETGIELQRVGIPHCLQTVIGSSNLPRARNELVARFLASDCTDVLLIDDDMSWRPDSVIRLVSSPQPFIGAVGRKRVDKPNTDVGVWCTHFAPGSVSRLVTDENGAVEVLRVGTGFLKISREVFTTLASRNPDWKRAGRDDMPAAVRDNYFRFFCFSDDDELGEDYVFCDRWRGEGGRVFIDPAVSLGHVGTKEYAGAIIDLMSTQEPPEAIAA